MAGELWVSATNIFITTMTSVYFLATRLAWIKIYCGTCVALMESIANPFATIIIGKIFKDIEKLITGELSTSKFLDDVQTYTYCLIGVTCYTAVVNSVGFMIWASISYQIGHSARCQLYKVLIQQKQAFSYDGNTSLSGLCMMYFKDIQDMEIATGTTSYELVAMGVGCLVEIGVAFYFSWAVTLVCLAGIPVIVLVGAVLSTPITKQIAKSKATLDSISERSSWVLSALQTVKLFQKENHESIKLHNGLTTLLYENSRYWFLYCLQQGICRGIVLLIFMQGFYFGSFMVKKRGLSAGDVVSVFWCCLNGSALLQTFMSHLIEWNKGKASAERLSKALEINGMEHLKSSIGILPNAPRAMTKGFEDLGWSVNYETASTSSSSTYEEPLKPEAACIKEVTSPHEVPTKIITPWKLEGQITFTDVVFSYPGRKEIVLAGASLEFVAGKTTFVLGRSGSGKSTIAAIVSKQYPWQAGEVTIDGHEVHLLSKSWVEKDVFVCEQLPQMFDISIRDNIRIGSNDYEHVTEEKIEMAVQDACADFIWQLPDRLDSMCASQLSGGQKQRISLARARLRNSPVMIFDEVTSALDKELQKEVFRKMASYREGKTTIVITHEHSVIPEGHRVYIIDNGLAFPFDSISQVYKDPRFEHLNSDSSEDEAESKEASIVTVVKAYDNDTLDSSDIESTPKDARSVSHSKITSLSFDLFKSLPNKMLFFIGMFATFIHSAINPVFSYCLSKLIMGILDPNTKDSTMWAMLILMCALLDGIVDIAKIFLYLAAERWLRITRERLFTKLLGQTTILEKREASYYSKMLIGDSEKCTEVVTKYWPGLLSIFVLGIAGFVGALAFGWKLTLVCSSLLPAFIVMNRSYKLLCTKWTKRREELRANVIRLMSDITSELGYKTLKIQHLEKYFLNLYLHREKMLNDISPAMITQVGFGYGFLKCFPYALETLLFWYGMRQIGKAEYSVQNTMTVFSMLMFSVITIDQLSTIISSVGQGFEALERLMIFFRDKNSAAEEQNVVKTKTINGEMPAWTNVKFYRISKSYPSGKKVLGGFSETFNEGETVALVGPSGIGKTSIARLLLGLETQTTGEIIIDGKWDLRDICLFDLRQNIGLVSQAPLDFFDGTIEENLLYGLDPNDTKQSLKMQDICKKCGAHEFITRLSEQYDTRMKSGLLSGGQMQRLGMARVMLREPKVLILDECTAALDVESKRIIKDLIVELKASRNMIIIIITHQMDVAKVADRIIQLK